MTPEVFFLFGLVALSHVSSVLSASLAARSTTTTSNYDVDTKCVNVRININDGEKSITHRLAAIERTLERIEKGLVDNASVRGSIVFRNCKEILTYGFTKSGVYEINPMDGHGWFDVYCDMETDGGGWVVFQRREDGSVNFYRDWTDYKTGFGDLDKEFWLGLDKISRLTKESSQTIRFDLSDFDDNSRYAQYKTFEVGNEASGYVLNVGSYSGDAGDSFIPQSNGMKFSTKDKDQDTWDTSCAQTFNGGWWFGDCHHSNLNGMYHKGVHKSFADGVNWRAWRGFKYSLKFTEMKVRPK